MTGWNLFGEVFITLFVIMDPVGCVPIFLALTASRPAKVRKKLALQAVITAAIVICAFALFGQQILSYLGITLPSLQVSGGLLLLLVALELLTGKIDNPEVSESDVNVALVPLGTPLLAGPGGIVATILFVQRADGANDLAFISAALLAVFIVLWLVLRFSVGIIRVIKDGGVTLLTRISGLLLAAIAVQMIADGVYAFVEHYSS